MSIAAILGVEDIDGPLMTAARAEWRRWVECDPALGAVGDLVDLRHWQQRAEPVDRDRPMVKLAALAVNDDKAAVALTWLLVPKAKRVAAELADVRAEVDGLVAGQLWIEIRSGNPPESYVATTIMRNVRKAVMAELGIGDACDRADRAWSFASMAGVIDSPAEVDDPDAAPELERVLRVVLQHLLDAGELTIRDVKVLASAADHADWLDKPMRGRSGLTSPDVLEVLTKFEPKKARTMRRDVGRLLDRIVVLAADLDVEMLLPQYPDDGVSFGDWVYGLGNPRQAAAMCNFREFEMSLTRAHISTWDTVNERCGAPDTCPECIREEGRREMAALAEAG